MPTFLNKTLCPDYDLLDLDWICHGQLLICYGDANQPHPNRLLWNDQRYSGVLLSGSVLCSTSGTPYHVSFELCYEKQQKNSTERIL